MNASSVQFTNHIDSTILNFSLNSATLRWNLILHTTLQWLVYHPKIQKISLQITMIISEIQDLFSKIIRFQAIFKGTVGFIRVLLFNFSSQLSTISKKQVSQRTPQNLLNSYSFISHPNLRFTISTNSSAVPSSPSVLLSISTSFFISYRSYQFPRFGRIGYIK